MSENEIVEIISKEQFAQIVKKHFETMDVSPHALFRVSEAQRKIYKPEMLKNVLKKEKPKLIGLQKNGRYCAFFRRKNHFIKIIFFIMNKKTEIITFFNINKLPTIKNV